MRLVKASLLMLASCASAQAAQEDFVLNDAKPYVYLEFHHVGPRTPIQEGEPATGLWLRIVNNCRVPTDPRRAHSESAGPTPTKAAAPEGYWAELHSVDTIAPGDRLLFSVPINHVGEGWFMRVFFTLAVSKPQIGDGPNSYVDFHDIQIPQKCRGLKQCGPLGLLP